MKHLYKLTSRNIPLLLGLFFFANWHEAKAQVTLYCPEEIVANVPPGLCGSFLDYSTISFNASAPLIDTQYIPAPGFFFELGINPVIIMVTAENGDVGSCSINFMVVEYPEMHCQPSFTVTLDENCQYELAWEELLQPQAYGCPDDFIVDVLDNNGAPLGNIVDGSFLGQNWIFRVLNPSNSTSCTGTLVINTTPLPPAITCPPDTVITCNTPVNPSEFGGPLLTGCFDETALDLTYNDVLVSSICDGDSIAFFLTRTWEAVDPFGNVTNCQHVITGRRITLNEVVFPPNYDGFDEPRIQCDPNASYLMQTDTSMTGVPTVDGHFAASSSCSFAVQFQDVVTQICVAYYKIERKWQVFDNCESEVLNHTQVIYVVDEDPPAYNIPDSLFVSTDPICSPTSMLPPIDLVHECSDFEVQITTPFGTLTTNGGPLNIPMIPGAYDAEYQVTDECLNDSIRNAKLIVTEGVVASCPDDVTITCDFYNDNLLLPLASGNNAVLSQFGDPVLFINCDFNVQQSVVTSVNGCGEGTITRSFEIETPGTPLTCNQIIYVNHISDFEVSFPGDTSLICGTEALNAGEPLILNEDCENIVVSMADSIVENPPAACYEILRTWTVRNLCVADPDAPDNIPDPLLPSGNFGDGGDGVITFTQTISVIDNTPPVFTNACNLPEICIYGTGCSGEVEIPMPEFTECSPYELTIMSDLGVGQGPFPGVIPGDYSVTFSITDQCGNQSSCNTTLTVVDCLPPTPVCFTNVTAVVEDGDPPSGILTAAELNGLSSDNCSTNLAFSFSADIEDDTLQLTCDDVGDLTVQLWVTDEAGNQAFCETTVQVQGASACIPTEIGGTIKTELGAAIAQVMVSNDLGQTFTTGPDGTYFFTDPAPGMTITPVKNINIANGVTTFDAVLITKHILGSQELGSPYKMIAADVNNSGSITTFDLVLMRKVILNISDEFPNNTSWRFIPEDYVFPNPANPWQQTFPEIIIFNNDPMITEYNFIGLKVGDVNNSANPLNFTEEEHFSEEQK